MHNRIAWCATQNDSMIASTRKNLLTAFAALALPGAALAHNYTYVEGGFVDRDLEGADDSGFRIAGSGQVHRQLALIGEYTDTGDLEQTGLGLRVFGPLRPDVDWTAAATMEFLDTRFDDDTGYGLRGGLRWRFARAFELNPEIVHFDVFDEGFTSLRLAGLFDIDPNLAVQAALQGGDDDRIEAGIRYSFAPRARR